MSPDLDKPAVAPGLTRLAAGVEYCGRPYAGFQRQPGKPTVQGALEQALSRVAAAPVTLTCAGRTDAGVSAVAQVIHFDTAARRDERAWVLGTNTYLPPEIAVTWVKPVPPRFHARFSATARRYCYVLQNTLYRPGILHAGVAVYHGNYDPAAMQAAAAVLRGEHDFSAFRAADDTSRTARRCVHFVRVTARRPYIFFDIAANAFLNHMVRNIVGSLLLIGAGRRPPAWLGTVLASRDRRLAGPTAKPDGLYLTSVSYPDEFGIPAPPPGLGPFWAP